VWKETLQAGIVALSAPAPITARALHWVSSRHVLPLTPETNSSLAYTAVVGAEAQTRSHQVKYPYRHMHHEARNSFSSLPRRVGRNCNTFDHWGSGATGCLPRAHSGQGALCRQDFSRWIGPSAEGQGEGRVVSPKEMHRT
jgi:hypothetical protein